MIKWGTAKKKINSLLCIKAYSFLLFTNEGRGIHTDVEFWYSRYNRTRSSVQFLIIFSSVITVTTANTTELITVPETARCQSSLQWKSFRTTAQLPKLMASIASSKKLMHKNTYSYPITFRRGGKHGGLVK